MYDARVVEAMEGARGIANAMGATRTRFRCAYSMPVPVPAHEHFNRG